MDLSRFALAAFATVAWAAEPVHVSLDGSGPGRTFQGIGAASGGGAVTRLLINYPEPQRSQILDYLFKPNYGASLQLLKIEIGGDGNSTEGAEPSHMHWAGDANYDRGYEWWVAAEAKKRNPHIQLMALAWDFPAWVKDVNSQATADYLVAFLEGNKRAHNLDFDYIGIWNETKTRYDFIKRLQQTLGAHHLKTRIMADDLVNTWAIADQMRHDPQLSNAVAVVNTHYPKFNSTEAARTSGKPVWSGEDGAWSDTWGAGHDQSGPYAQVLNRNYQQGRMTCTILWCLSSSYYDILDVPYAGLIRAATPWSGHYEAVTPLWIVAHTTQFAQPGWQYLDRACGRLPEGGSYVTLKNGADYSIIVETIYGANPQRFDFYIRGGSSQGKVRVWRTNRRSAFETVGEITPVNGRYAFTADPDSVYTLTTTTGQRKGGWIAPADKPFPMPYRDNFEKYAVGNTTPDYFIEQNGSYEVAPCGAGRSGKCLRQVVDQSPIVWTSGATAYLLGTASIIGAKNWSNYAVASYVLLEQPGYARVMGRISRVTLDGQIAGYQLYLYNTGKWELRTSTKSGIIASGTAPFSLNTWRRMELAFHGDRVTARIAGREVANLQDTTYTHGMAGIGNNYNRGQYDNFEIRPVADSVPVFAPLSAGTQSVPGAPALLPPTPLNGGVLLAWSQVEGATGYKLHMGTEPGKYATTINAGPLHSYRAWTLTNGKMYYFAVSAYNPKGESKISNQVQAIPSASGQ
jgi:O-glycosyl hydrolase